MENEEEIKIVDDLDSKDELFNLYKEVWLDTYVSPENNINKEDIASFWENKEPISTQSKISDDQKLFLIAKKHNVIVATASVFRLKEKQHILYLKTLYIKPEFQRKNIGTKFINYIKNYFKDFNVIYLETAKYNTKAINFYIKNGFTVEDGWQGVFDIGNNKNIPTIRLVYRKQKPIYKL